MPHELSLSSPCVQLREQRLQAVRQKLVTDNKPLIHWALRRFFSMAEEKTKDYDDACQEAQAAMAHAAEMYDPERLSESTGKPVKFGSYATVAIINHMIRWREKRCRNGFTNVGDSYHKSGPRTFAKMPISIERAFNRTDADRPIEETVSAMAIEYDFDTSIQYAECMEVIHKTLKAREIAVLMKCAAEGKRQSDVARELKISKERVRQILNAAVIKVRRAMRILEEVQG